MVEYVDQVRDLAVECDRDPSPCPEARLATDYGTRAAAPAFMPEDLRTFERNSAMQ